MRDESGAVSLVAIEGRNIDTVCYRGSAPIRDLARISQPDVFDQETNADGLQRDLSPKHAQDAYEYVRRDAREAWPRAFPEVVLNVRDPRVLKRTDVWDPDDITIASSSEVAEALKAQAPSLVLLRFHTELMHRSGTVYVSRVDGNHRLEHANGDDRREPLDKWVPYQIHVGLTPDQERSLFVDINSNQKGLNSSHLSIMQSKLTPEEEEIKNYLWRWICRRLAEDPASPWHGLVHMGGSTKGSRAQGLTRVVNFASLETGVRKLLTKSQYIHDLRKPEAQYAIVRNYWHAVKKVYAEEWADPKAYLLMKNIGVQSFSILGGTIIDRCMPRQKVRVEDMETYLFQTRGAFNWHGQATGENSVRGMTGNQAATIVAGYMAGEISDDTGLNVQLLQDQLTGTATR